MAALITKRPYVQITSDQAKRLATALANIAKQYKIEFNPAIVAWLQLLGVSAAVYGPMLGVEIMQRKQAAAQRRAVSTMANAGQTAPVQMSAAPQAPAPAANDIAAGGQLKFG